MNKKVKVLIIVMVVVLVATACSNNGGVANDSNSKKVVAVVNGVNITQGELDSYIKLYSKGILETMVQDKLLELAAKDKGIEVTEEFVNTELENYKKIIGTEEDFVNFLNEKGIAEEGFKLNIKQMALRNSLMEKIKQEIELTDEELKTKFEENPTDYFIGKFNEVVVGSSEDVEIVKEKLGDGVTLEQLKEELGEKIHYAGVIENVDKNFGELGESLKHIKPGDTLVMKSGEQFIVYQLIELKDNFEDLKDMILEGYKEEQKYIKFEEFIREITENAKIEYKE